MKSDKYLFIFILVCCLFLTGCSSIVNFDSESYNVGFLLHNINDTTDTN